MSRWLWLSICAVVGLELLLCGLLVPAHLRAVDVSVLQRAGRNTPSVVDCGLTLLNDRQLGTAQLLLRQAQASALPQQDWLSQAVRETEQQHPRWQSWGGGGYHLAVLFQDNPSSTSPGPASESAEPLTSWAIKQPNRAVVLALLEGSSRPAEQELLRCRALTNTSLFSPSQSASGQALDAALAISGLLLQEHQLAPSLSNALYTTAVQANRGGSSQPLEQMLMDLTSLGQRFNWDQLATFVSRIDTPETLRQLANLIRQHEEQLPLLFSAVTLSGQPAEVARYLVTFNQSGWQDLQSGLRFRAGGLKELLACQQRVYSTGLGQHWAGYVAINAITSWAAGYAWVMPRFALAMKWLFYLAGGFLLALALHFAWPAVSDLERPLQVRGFHFARELLFALGFLLVILLLSEPFLAQESQKVDIPFRLRLPPMGTLVPAGVTQSHPSLMNQQLSLLTLLLFFVLQGLIYTACLVKLAEIRRQMVPPRIKLKLLENEDHLFDAGLYLGFVGTIISLILVSMGVIKFSLMAAYSSTSFGIIFVSVFKIFHLRPLRRKLLLEAEAIYPETALPAQAPKLAPLP